MHAQSSLQRAIALDLVNPDEAYEAALLGDFRSVDLGPRLVAEVIGKFFLFGAELAGAVGAESLVAIARIGVRR